MKRFILLLVMSFLVVSLSIPALAADQKVVAVTDFSNNTDYYMPDIGRMAAETLAIRVSNINGFKVVERAKLSKIFKEQEMATKSGLVDNTDAAIQMGKLLGANYLITGALNNITEEEYTFEGYGVKTTKTDIMLDVSIKMINVNTGTIELAGLYSASQSFQDSKPSKMTSIVRNLLKNTYRQFINDANEILTEPVEENETVKVQFMSTPAGADIEIDGIYMGSTPATIPFQKGVHTVRISMAGYESWEKKVMFFEGLKVNPTLGKEKGGE